ncbi:hypothetical protein GQ44DRAFT_732482 [Phaeosphaeriaceae sp. PMI808]|nr:hypothetical protein GQ44DRAFT_732482 [Phaeosphaeriaceae sp. PMI808]
MDDRSGEVIGVAVTFFVLTWFTVGLRCYVRTFLVKAFGIDDKIMVATLCLFTAYLSCQLGGAAHGTGQHREAITDANAQIALRYWFFCEVFYPWQLPSSKSLSCKPISFWWDLDPNHTGTCLSAALVTNFTYVVSTLNSLADWTFGTLPIFIVKNLQMKKRMKIVVASVIAFAAIGSTATIIRLPYSSSLKEYKGDFLYRTTGFAIWTTVEVGVGITAGCIATLRPLMARSGGLPSFGTSGGQSSGMPWSKGSKDNNHGAPRLGMQPLDELRPAAKMPVMTPTVTNGRLRSGSDEESFLGTGASSEGWERGITKKVATRVVADSRIEEWRPSKAETRARGGSLGGILSQHSERG